MRSPPARLRTVPLLPPPARCRTVEARNEDRNSARRRPVSAAETATGAFFGSSGRRERGRWSDGRQLRAHCRRGRIEAGEVRGCLESFLYHQVAGHVHVVRPPGRSCKLFIEKILSWDVIVIVINITVKESNSYDEQCRLSFGF